MEDQKPPVIDLEQVIASKNPRLLKVLPGFVLRMIKNKIHQDEMNEFLKLYHTRQGLDFVDAVLSYFKVNLVVKGIENIPKEGGIILAANHPLGGFDGLALLKVVGDHRTKKDVQFIVNDILLNLKNLAPVFVPVNKHGKNTSEVYSKLDETYRSEQAVLIFPAGLVSRKQQGFIRDLDWKKSFIVQARKNEREIYPVYIHGRNSSFFYNFALLRKKLGIKANLEMFFLPDEMFKQRNKTITIIFGKPISWKALDKSKSDHEWASWFREHVYELGKQNGFE
jgi:putative hemolysin